MAQTLYAPLNGVSDEVKKILVSTGGLSDYVVKGYCSVNGLSKLFFGDGGEDTGFWFYYSTIAEKIIQYRPIAFLPPLVDSIVNKLNNGIAFYCITTDNTGSCVLTLSTDRNAIDYVNIEGGQYSISPTIGNITINDEVWYFAYYNMRPNATAYDIVPDCAIVNQSFSSMTPAQIVTWIVNNRIYTNDFAENYQVGQTYNLVKGNIEKTVRKFLAIYLYKMMSWKTSTYNTSYNLICSNIENIISYFVQHSGGNDIIDLWADYNSSNNGIRLGAYYSNESTNNVLIESLDPDDGGYAMVETDAYLHYSSCVYIDFNSDGTIAYETPSWTADDTLYIGKGGYGWDYMHLSNVGLNFLPHPVPTYNIVPEYTYVVNNTYQVHNLLTPQVTLDALYQYFDRIYSSSLSSVTYLKEHWSEIRSDILSYISSFNTVYLSFLVNKRNNQVNITANVGQNTYPKATVIASQASPRYGTIWRINNNTSENIQTTHYYNITITSNSYTADTPTSWTSNMYEIGLYGAISDNVNVTDTIVLSSYGMCYR